MKHAARWRLAGITTLAALGCAATIASGSSSGSESSSSPSSGGQSTESSAPSESATSEAPQASGPGIGDPAADGKFTFTVTKVKCGVKQVGSQYVNEKAKGQFCLVTMNVKNTGDEAQTFDAGSQEGTVNGGATVKADGTASLYANKDGDTFLEQINPGNQLSGVVIVYDIAKNQKLETVILHDSPFSGGVSVSVA